MKKINSYYVYIVFALFLLINTNAVSQPGNGNGNPPPWAGPPPPKGTPIDGGVVFLLVSGLLLGVSKLRKKDE